MRNITNLIPNPFLALFIALIVMACEPQQEDIDYQPESEFSVSPSKGNTTTIFQFDASSSLNGSLKDNPTFLRWDWDSDGKWDKMYTSGGSYTHRFFQKGTYTVALQASTLLGRKDTSMLTIVIAQGYSEPRAAIYITPDSANIYTEFIFDASESKDDEDSLQQLMFRWDFEGDMIWDTEFSSSPIAKFQYPEQAIYPVKLEVKDPQDMRNTTVFNLIVTRLNDKIIPIMDYECWPCTMEDTVKLDGGRSYVSDDPDAQLLYSWDIFNDNIWEAEHSQTSIFNYKIPFEGVHEIKLRVTDHEGLYMDTVVEVEIFPFNTPPIVDLILGNRYGNPSSRFYLHGKGSYDRETSYFERELRWDLNGDGVWEEEYNDLYEVWTQYDEPGEYPVALQITDGHGKYTTAYDTIMVFPGNRETDIIVDKRGNPLGEFYGIVKIGNNWWTQNNSRYKPPAKGASYSASSYNREIDSVYKYGYLYPYNAITDKFYPCPKGWRIPTLDDWNQLMKDLGPEPKIADLLLGGSSELQFLLTGQGFGSGRNFSYMWKGRILHYYTSSTNINGHPYLWYIDKLLNKNQMVIANRSYTLPVRCIKN